MVGIRRLLTGWGVASCVFICLLAATVPRSDATFTAKVTDGSNTAGTAAYFTCAAAYSATAPSINYKLDDTAGTGAADASRNGRNGTYQGGVTKGVAGTCRRDNGTAVRLDGSSGYIDCGTSLSLSLACTGEIWFKTTSTTGGLLIGFGASATGSSASVDRVVYLTDAGKVAFRGQ